MKRIDKNVDIATRMCGSQYASSRLLPTEDKQKDMNVVIVSLYQSYMLIVNMVFLIKATSTVHIRAFYKSH